MSSGNHGTPLGTGTGVVEGHAAHDLGRLGGGPIERREGLGEGLAGAEREGRLVAVLAAGGVGRGGLPLEDQVEPRLLHRRHVLDEAADGERAHGRGQAGLLVGEAEGGVADAVALLGDVGEQQLALVGVDGGLSWHGELHSGGGSGHPSSSAPEVVIPLTSYRDAGRDQSVGRPASAATPVRRRRGTRCRAWAISARTGAPERTTSTIVSEVWVWPRADRWRTGTPAASSASA